MSQNRKFANFANQVSNELPVSDVITPGEVTPAPVPVPAAPVAAPMTRKKVDRQVEPVKLVQARVPLSQQRNFVRTLLDIQDFFNKEVSQEEGIGALLALVNNDEGARAAWVEMIHTLRG